MPTRAGGVTEMRTGGVRQEGVQVGATETARAHPI